jgi:hypothetical protein
MELANEYAEVRVRTVQTRNGVRLEIVAGLPWGGIPLCPVAV